MYSGRPPSRSSSGYGASGPSSAAMAPTASAQSLARQAAGMLLHDEPCYISARSANSIISEEVTRPTRITADCLLLLNKMLDELLLLVLLSARSLATDRIKTEGVLRVMNNSLLAKDAVLEAELELRSYTGSKRAEGARVPLGLSATSRWDGTANFPVASAYDALRTRCQIYSTLGDREDVTASAAGDAHLMSPEGKPVATLTPGVCIYVTTLLEYVGEKILQHTSRVVERDNSDEASTRDLYAAITEDEMLAQLLRAMEVRHDFERSLTAAERAAAASAADDGGAGGSKAARPWQVPSSDTDYEQAAGASRFAKRMSRQDLVVSTALANGNGNGAAAAADAHAPRSASAMSFYMDSRDGPRSPGPYSAGPNSAGGAPASAEGTPHQAQQASGFVTAAPGSGFLPLDASSPAAHAAAAEALESKQSKKAGSSFLNGVRRRGSFKRDGGATPDAAAARQALLEKEGRAAVPDIAVDPEDDFDALMLSGQTMKVSLTPNRLRSMEVEQKDAGDAGRNARRRPPGVLPTPPLEGSPGSAAGFTFGGRKGPASPHIDQMQTARSITPSGRHLRGATAPPSSYRAMSPSPGSAPPSSYRGGPPADGRRSLSMSAGTAFDEDEESTLQSEHAYSSVASHSSDAAGSTGLSDFSPKPARRSHRMQPRSEHEGSAGSRELVDLLNRGPPDAGPAMLGSRDSRSSTLDGSTPKSKSSVGDRVRNIFGGRSASKGSGRDSIGSLSSVSKPSMTQTRSFGTSSTSTGSDSGNTRGSLDDPSAASRKMAPQFAAAPGTQSIGRKFTSSSQTSRIGLPLVQQTMPSSSASQQSHASTGDVTGASHSTGDLLQQEQQQPRLPPLPTSPTRGGLPPLPEKDLSGAPRAVDDNVFGPVSNAPLSAPAIAATGAAAAAAAAAASSVTASPSSYRAPQSPGDASLRNAASATPRKSLSLNEPPSKVVPWGYNNRRSSTGLQLASQVRTGVLRDQRPQSPVQPRSPGLDDAKAAQQFPGAEAASAAKDEDAPLSSRRSRTESNRGADELSQEPLTPHKASLAAVPRTPTPHTASTNWTMAQEYSSVPQSPQSSARASRRLLDLEVRMRACDSADACRALLRQFIELSGAAATADSGAQTSQPDREAAPAGRATGEQPSIDAPAAHRADADDRSADVTTWLLDEGAHLDGVGALDRESPRHLGPRSVSLLATLTEGHGSSHGGYVTADEGSVAHLNMSRVASSASSKLRPASFFLPAEDDERRLSNVSSGANSTYAGYTTADEGDAARPPASNHS